MPCFCPASSCPGPTRRRRQRQAVRASRLLSLQRCCWHLPRWLLRRRRRAPFPAAKHPIPLAIGIPDVAQGCPELWGRGCFHTGRMGHSLLHDSPVMELVLERRQVLFYCEAASRHAICSGNTVDHSQAPQLQDNVLQAKVLEAVCLATEDNRAHVCDRCGGLLQFRVPTPTANRTNCRSDPVNEDMLGDAWDASLPRARSAAATEREPQRTEEHHVVSQPSLHVLQSTVACPMQLERRRLQKHPVAAAALHGNSLQGLLS
mmetsp:Transcript_30900/g.67690  ORF Transcript_30900/g.67690 Transcript_30900/m.67690 type:complete len:261 (+) Transcript_30900:278-1060(+)